MDEKIRRKIHTLLDQHRIMTIATLRPDGWPQATTVGYVNEGLTLYFLCGLDSQKAADDYIAADNPYAAVRVVEYIRHAARSLETSRALGRPTSKPGIREFILTRQPYILAYEITDDAVRILAIFHHRQNRP